LWYDRRLEQDRTLAVDFQTDDGTGIGKASFRRGIGKSTFVPTLAGRPNVIHLAPVKRHDGSGRRRRPPAVLFFFCFRHSRSE
jgi:hypothetical protein